jgi:serine/threonine protein kinase
MTDLADLYTLENYIDTFALGHYARVFEARDHRNNQQVAFKVLRTEHLSADGDIRWEFRAFPHEAVLLVKLASSPHVLNLIDCGYVASYSDVPTDGQIISFQRDVAAFAKAMPDYAERNWRPYLALTLLPRTNNLFYLMKPTQQVTRWRLPTEEGVALALQFTQVLQLAHQQSIVYMDHKLEHVYWDGSNLQVIDLNSSRQLDSFSDDTAQAFRQDIHNLCVGILYPIFTGLSPVSATLRPQPGNLAQIEARYRNVTTLDFGAEPSLSPAIQDLLQQGASMQIETVAAFSDALQGIAAAHGWDFPEQHTTPASRAARDALRKGLHNLREGQAKIREARDFFRDAAIIDDLPEDIEAELRRLVKAANAMLNERVIP